METTIQRDSIELVSNPAGLEMGSPTSAQLELINQYRPRGVKERSPGDFVVVPFLASHNLLNYSRGVWSQDALKQMAASFAGVPLILNHSHGDVNETVGFIFDAALFQLNDAPDAIANAADHWDINRGILQRDGFTALVLLGAIASDQPIIADIEQRRVNQVSTGVLTDGSLFCPHCHVDFDNYELCEHYIPYGMSGYQIRKLRDKGAPLADYYVRKTALESIELSFVVSGNYPGASVIGE